MHRRNAWIAAQNNAEMALRTVLPEGFTTSLRVLHDLQRADS